MDGPVPNSIRVRKEEGVTILWSDGTHSTYPAAHLRRLSPSAEARELRKSLATNPLTVLPTAPDTGPIQAVDVELVGNYALRIRFSDGHSTGLYTWEYLRQIDPERGTYPPP